MSELNSTIDFLENSAVENPPTDKLENELMIEDQQLNDFKLFNIQEFGQELYQKSEKRNKARALRANQNITGYDISQNCIQQILFKLRNTPIRNYADSWLPIFMRTEVGSAVHNFIQNNTNQFTETEINLKIPSIGFYGKIDYLINDNVLGEIKTCTYEDYSSILRKKKPREKDFKQAFTYHYIISNYLEEAKNAEIPYKNEAKPKLNKYNIKKIQFLYISHDLISSQAESYGEMLEKVKITKKNLDSKKNPFFFITSVVVDLDEKIINEYYDYISGKFEDIHHYMKTNTNPAADARYLNPKGCFFCPYKSICEYTTWN